MYQEWLKEYEEIKNDKTTSKEDKEKNKTV